MDAATGLAGHLKSLEQGYGDNKSALSVASLQGNMFLRRQETWPYCLRSEASRYMIQHAT